MPFLFLCERNSLTDWELVLLYWWYTLVPYACPCVCCLGVRVRVRVCVRACLPACLSVFILTCDGTLFFLFNSFKLRLLRWRKTRMKKNILIKQTVTTATIFNFIYKHRKKTYVHTPIHSKRIWLNNAFLLRNYLPRSVNANSVICVYLW